MRVPPPSTTFNIVTISENKESIDSALEAMITQQWNEMVHKSKSTINIMPAKMNTSIQYDIQHMHIYATKRHWGNRPVMSSMSILTVYKDIPPFLSEVSRLTR